MTNTQNVDYTAITAQRHGTGCCAGCVIEAYPTDDTHEPLVHIVRDPFYLYEASIVEDLGDEAPTWVLLLCSRHLTEQEAENGPRLTWEPLTNVIDRIVRKLNS